LLVDLAFLSRNGIRDKEDNLSMANLIHHRQFTVEWGACDPAGIVFNGRFFEFFDVSAWDMFESALAVRRADLFAAFDIMGIPLVDARARFILPVKFGDLAEIASEITEFRRSSFDIAHRLSVGGELAVEGRETRVWSTRDKDDPSRIRSTPIPAQVIERFRAP
jgi:4-hydroxybenzoyl-CoA thioesterase